ncbi:MAG: HAD superfamily hydrolase (TIGR01549 family) [Rickettsiales bacterium]|jgi:HAD superfamily hydrolase (TIGR01549 family)
MRLQLLFYIEPWIELQDPKFRFNSVNGQFYKQILGLSSYSKDIQFNLLISKNLFIQLKEINSAIIDLIGENNIFTIDESLLLDIFPNVKNAQHHWYNGTYTNQQLFQMQHFVREAINNDKYIPDIIISWESINIFLQKQFPNTLFINQTPGIFSRIPFVDSVMLDPCGVFKDGFMQKHHNEINKLKLSDDETNYLRIYKENYTDSLKLYNPWKVWIDEKKSKFRKLLLLPLQISDYLSFKESCNYNNQFEYLTDILSKTDLSIGVIVTQYITPKVNDTSINQDSIRYLEETFPNFIYNPEFDKVNFCSQLILSSVDAVITVSSAVGLQGMLWDIPIFLANEKSYIAPLGDTTSIEEINSFLLESREHKNKDNILHFYLSRMSIPVEECLWNGEWYYKFLIKSLKKYKEDIIGVDFYEKIKEDPKEHWDKISNPNLDRMLRYFSKDSNLKLENNNACLDLIKTIRDSKYKVISFDIFDTLLIRPFFRPIDLLKFIEPKVHQILGSSWIDYVEYRQKAALIALQKAKDQNQHTEDTTLESIYIEFQALLNITKYQSEKIKDLEIEYETRFLYRRESVCNAFKEAVNSGKKVILVSDMYLSQKTIKKLLDFNKIIGYRKLYLSSAIGLRKKTGSLYKHVIQQENVKPNEILHIGDNFKIDIDYAKKFGITPYHVPNIAGDILRKKKLNNLFTKTDLMNNDLSIYIGLIINKMFDNPESLKTFDKNSLFNGSAYNLGYSSLGIMFFNFVQWTIEQSINDGIEKLYFLARDGFILKKIYDLISPFYKNSPKSEYLYCSRRICVSEIKNRSDIQRVLLRKNNANTKLAFTGTLRLFMSSKIDINIDDIERDIIANSGIESPDSSISDADVKNLQSFLFEIEDVIYEKARSERELYLEYLSSKDLNNKSTKVAVVDIGYGCTMQKSLQNIIGCKLQGYYLMTLSSATEFKKNGGLFRSLYGDLCVTGQTNHPLCKLNRIVYETFYSNHEGSFIMMRKINNSTIPILHDVSDDQKRISIVKTAQDGALDFINDLKRFLGPDIVKFYINPTHAIRCFTNFVENPYYKDVKIVEGIKFEDYYTGHNTRFLVSPKGQAKSAIWVEGNLILRQRGELNNKIVVKKIEKSKLVVENVEKNATINKYAKKIVIYVIKKFSTPKKYLKFQRDPYIFLMDSSKWYLKKLAKFFI